MHLDSIGINSESDSSFYVNRPNGSQNYLFLRIRSSAFFHLNGNTIKVEPNSIILFEKGYPQDYRAATDYYSDDYVHFSVENDLTYLHSLNIPFNTIIKVQDLSFVLKILDMLYLENISNLPHNNDSIHLLLMLLVTKISEQFTTTSQSHQHRYQDFLSLRAKIYSNPSYDWNITSIARETSLSPSHFQSLYKTFFGVSCFSDIIDSRMQMARYYLQHTDYSIKKISELCGYENDVHFMRQFKKTYKETAGSYRRNFIHQT